MLLFHIIVLFLLSHTITIIVVVVVVVFDHYDQACPVLTSERALSALNPCCGS